MSKKLQTQDQKSIAKRFTDKVLAEVISNSDNGISVPVSRKKLIQGYFVAIDRALQKAEETRLDKKKGGLPYNWNNVNLDSLALDVMYYSKLGLDMQQQAHLYPIPYKNNRTGKYDINLMMGYAGKELITKKYALDKPLNITFELVKATDKFEPIKKDRDNNVESYKFEITNPFDRGDVIGGFAYIEYSDPSKNKLIIMSLAEILKRKPKYASPQVWGTWNEDMYLKTLKRAVYHSKYIPLDPAKIDDELKYIENKEIEAAADMVVLEQEEAISNIVIIDEETGEVEGVTFDQEEAEVVNAEDVDF